MIVDQIWVTWKRLMVTHVTVNIFINNKQIEVYDLKIIGISVISETFSIPLEVPKVLEILKIC